MSSDALLMPAAPQPPAGGGRSTQSTAPASFKLDRSAKSSDHHQSFLSTLNRVSGRKTRHDPQATAGEHRTAKREGQNTESAIRAQRCPAADQDAAHDRAAESVAPAFEREALVDGRRPAIGLIDAYLFKAALTDESGSTVATESDGGLEKALSFLRRLLAALQSEDQKMSNGRVGIGPFEQLQTQISPEANNLYFFKQIAARVIHQQLVADRSGPHADAQFFQFWRALAATPAEQGSPGSQTQALGARIDALLNHLLKLHQTTSSAQGLEAVSAEADTPKAAVNLEAFDALENRLLHKFSRAADPTQAHAPEMNKLANPSKDGQLFAGIPKDLNSETAGDPPLRQGAKNSLAAYPNLAAESFSTKPSEDPIGLKNAVLQNDMLSAGKAGSKVIQIDGEAKDSGFLTQQEHLPEHLTKSEHSARSAEAAQRSLTSQTMNQIVQKAVLLQNNGQHAVQIDLKPDFLGQIRMQIVTESQQVSVRIVAELPFVKDMLESNLNQLKAELQAQGLQVDELEVSVAHDSRADDDQYQQAAQARRAQNMKNNPISEDAAAEEQSGRPGSRDDEMADTVIDYFA